MIKRYPYLNVEAGNTVMPIPSGLSHQDILYVDREGIGILVEGMFSTGSFDTQIHSFRRESVRLMSFSPGRWMVTMTSAHTRRYALSGGSSAIMPGIIYAMKYRGVEVRYTVQPGDTLSLVIAGMVSAINSATYPSGYDLNASGTTSLTIETEAEEDVGNLVSGSRSFNFKTIWNNNHKFESGYYITLNILGEISDYLILINENYTDYPSLPTLSTYDFASLTKATGGIYNYLRALDSMYSATGEYSSTLVGNAEITNIPYIPSTTSRCVFDADNSRIVFGTALHANENLVMLYR